MTIPVTVSERDLMALLGIVTDHRGADPGDGLPTACRVPIPTGPVTCAASPGSQISTAHVNGMPPACTATIWGRPGSSTS